MLALGYDRMVAAAVIIVGAGVGTMGSTINPFATGVASESADIGLGDGIVLRLVIYVVLTAIAIGYVVRYATRVKADHARSLVGFSREDEDLLTLEGADVHELTSRRRGVLGLTAATFAFMLYALVPWAQVFQGPDAASYPRHTHRHFPELPDLFVAMA